MVVKVFKTFSEDWCAVTLHTRDDSMEQQSFSGIGGTQAEALADLLASLEMQRPTSDKAIPLVKEYIDKGNPYPPTRI